MTRIFKLLCLLACLLIGFTYGQDEPDAYAQKDPQVTLQKSMKAFEEKAKSVATQEDVITAAMNMEDSQKIYLEMSKMVDKIIEMVMLHPSTAYYFLKEKGMERIIVPYIGKECPTLRALLLVLMKHLLDVTPSTVLAWTPFHLADSLVDIFENDDDEVIKTNALEVLSLWLPKNPKAQARVMKMHGLEPFYQQVENLEPLNIHTMLEMFAKIIKENIAARDNPSVEDDIENLNVYKKIGLIERMSTTTVCDGLLEIFQKLWDESLEGRGLVIAVYDLLNVIKGFCINKFSNKSLEKALKLIKNLKSFAISPAVKDNVEMYSGMNEGQLDVVFKEYIVQLQNRIKAREEL